MGDYLSLDQLENQAEVYMKSTLNLTRCQWLASAFGFLACLIASPLSAQTKIRSIKTQYIVAVAPEGVTSSTGAQIALPNREARTEIEVAVHEIHKIETALEPRFQEHFVNASAIPNAVEPFPILKLIVTLLDVNHNTGGEGCCRRRRRKPSAE